MPVKGKKIQNFTKNDYLSYPVNLRTLPPK